jgi:hypothetical protein
VTKPTPENVAKALDAIADVVWAYRPKTKTKGAKKRRKREAKIENSSRKERNCAETWGSQI